MREIPVRFPPPIYSDGVIRPVFVECGKETRLSGKLVVCIRRAGHPVAINYGHSNGYDEWCFDE